MPLASSASPLSISGRLWYTILHEPVRYQYFPAHVLLTQAHLVREILPEHINQIISLLAGPEIDQQEVGFEELNSCLPLTYLSVRRPAEQLQSCPASLGKRFWERLSPS